MPEKEYFIDSHCHFFNLDDVPIYPTLMAQIPVNTLLVLGLLFRKLAKKALKEFKPLIQFFERSRTKNLELYSEIVWQQIAKNRFEGVIFTPLIMDFTVIKNSCENVYEQTSELLGAASDAEDTLTTQHTKILPFVGVDLRHFDACDTVDKVAETIRSLIGQIVDFNNFSPPDSIEQAQNGAVAGIKLYPPIGFHLWPEDPVLRENYLNFFRFCEHKQIPITSHCQPLKAGSYRPDDSSPQDVDLHTHPDNWSAILDVVPNLRLNLAHFGGEKNFKKTWLNSQGYPKEPRKDTWVWEIIRLLKIYPNTYADLSAFAFDQKRCTEALGALLLLDANGLIDPYFESTNGNLFPIKNKILWGSDLPMILDSKDANYVDMYSHFTEALDLRTARRRMRESGRYRDTDISLPPAEELLINSVSKNPAKFLCPDQ